MILKILTPLVGVLGALLLSFGVWIIYPPAGYIAGGLLCLAWSWLSAKALSNQQDKPAGGE
ncbi:MAG: hypothetical protein ACRC8O_03230 [Plesiomonas shigelloides]|uniref:hypothetical protein n=1 Tax=Plesiomonas shigelloides TaxID=703 RepID=UPI001E5A2D2F|nr:hypothetical protein [Plesiomonas shigelloides]